MSGNRLTFSATLDDKVSKGLTLISKRFKETGTQASFLGNVGAKAVSQGFSLIDRALSGTISFLGNASDAAAAEEVSIARLTSSLKANVPAWDGNTDAIEATIKARMKLGFSDDEQRESLARLVGATHDSTKALDLQRTAMDLARFKNISLAEASEALIRIEGGQFRALKGLIGSTKDITTTTEAMAAVQRVAGGAAEDLAKTQSGRLLNSQVKVGEAMEKFGAKVLPLVVEGTETLAGVVEGVAGAFDLLNGKLPETEQGYAGIVDTLNSLNPMTWGYSRALENAEKQQAANTEAEIVAADAARALAGAHGAAASSIGVDARSMRSSIDDFGRASDRVSVTVVDDLTTIIDAFASSRSTLETAATGVADAMYDPILAKAELATIELEAKRLRNLRNASKAGSIERAEAETNLNEINKKHIEVLATLASYGDKAAAKTLTEMRDAAVATGRLTREQIVYWNNLIAKIGQYNAKFSGSSGHHGPQPRASGGPVYPGQTYTVGESGPEKLLMGPTGGYVIPNAGGGGSRGSATPMLVQTNIYLDSEVLARQVDKRLYNSARFTPDI